MKCIAVVMAMGAEASPVLTALGARSVTGHTRFPFLYFEAERHGCRVLVTVNGRDRRHGVDSIGTEPAALNTYATIERFSPDVVISAGTAGGWERSGGAIGDVYLSDRHFVFHDRRIGIAEFSPYGVGSYAAAPVDSLATALGLKTGIVTTGSSLDESAEDRVMIEASGACVKDMEAAAVAYVCEVMQVPMFAVKAITDLVDHHTATADQFNANLALASRRLAETMVKVVDFCAIRQVKDLG